MKVINKLSKIEQNDQVQN